MPDEDRIRELVAQTQSVATLLRRRSSPLWMPPTMPHRGKPKSTTEYKRPTKEDYSHVLTSLGSGIENKRKQALKKFGRLACEACGFDFLIAYGERGEGFIECHQSLATYYLSEANFYVDALQS